MSDMALATALLATLFLYEHHNRTDLTAHLAATERLADASASMPMITCPLRHPDFATVMQAAVLGDGMLIVEQQTQTRVRHIKDC
ncbi:hypothetical protein MWN34_16135 [Ancylobacter sp. 6x-1]|uniref:Uncharacterized protein n=1 Tax=Ancylobacter crimeensis TaxID=2579147 RepID=A0ABT0DEQ3_9HYPH|nr:hypothetical protein [Ancylobacter crimeensis]MCK0198443.1 hypothetical protein [Ancylobacter crimeensis]